MHERRDFLLWPSIARIGERLFEPRTRLGLVLLIDELASKTFADGEGRLSREAWGIQRCICQRSCATKVSSIFRQDDDLCVNRACFKYRLFPLNRGLLKPVKGSQYTVPVLVGVWLLRFFHPDSVCEVPAPIVRDVAIEQILSLRWRELFNRADP